MSADAEDMKSATDVTHARILNRLFDEETKKFHTEINNPMGMSGFDMVIPFVYDEFGVEEGDILASWADAFRTNMVAKGRARAKEIIEGVKAELAREEREIRDRMLGTLSR